MTLNRPLLAALCATALLAPLPGRANDRAFAFTYESAVLPAGAREFEMSTTWRHRRANEFGNIYYSAFDQRLELEMGLGHDVQTSLYLNFKDVSEEQFDALGNSLGNRRESAFDGISSEWKWKLKDASADALGVALYGELSVASDEAELEAKLILDKVIGRHRFAYNLVVAKGWEYSAGGSEGEFELENDLAYAYHFTDRLSAGAELRNHNENAHGEWEHKALFFGPNVHYSGRNWWVTLTWQQQLPAIQRSVDQPRSRYVLDAHEKTNVRLLWSWSF